MRLFKFILLIVIFSALFWAWGFYTNPGRDALRLQTTGVNSHFFVTPTESFQKYVSETTTMIKAAREKAGANATDEVVAENAPAVLLPNPATCKLANNQKNDKGILLIHGLLDSGYSMQQLGKFFQSQCFVVYVLLLPGHGTVPGDLLETTYSDWMKATDFGTTELAKHVNHVFIGGHSLGGLLATYEALRKPNLISGVILFAPALKINSSLTPFIPVVYWLSRVIDHLQWWSVYEDTALTRYESMALNPVYQIAELEQKVQNKLAEKTLSMPLFIEQSEQDDTIDATATAEFFKSCLNPLNRMLWFYEEGTYEPLADPRIQLIKSTLMDQRILSMSHLSLTLPESDPIYGINGQYRDCLYYPEQSANWQQCKTGKENYYGELTKMNLRDHILQRITFNPFYPFVLDRINGFIKSF